MLFCMLVVGCLFNSCKDVWDMETELSPVPDGERIVVSFMPYGVDVNHTRAEIPDNYFESAVKSLDVFIFDELGNKQYYSLIEYNEKFPDDGTLVLTKSRNEFSLNENYTIHLIANADADTFNPDNIRTFIDLQNATEKNESIHLMAVDATNNKFVMYGQSDAVVLNSGENQNITVEIPLVREAAKIELELIEGKIKDKNGNETEEYFTFSEGACFRFSNLQTVTRYVYDKDNLPNNDLVNTDLTNNCVNGPVINDAQPRSITITTYAYPNNWDNEREKMTHLVVQLPYEENGEKKLNNFYSIPITLQTSLLANHVYKIKAIIDAAGSTTDYKPKDIEGSYSVIDWTYEDINIGGGTIPHYLTFDKDHLVMRGIENDSIGFASSHDLKIVLDEAYFYNKYGEKKDIKNNDGTFNIKINSHPDVSNDGDELNQPISGKDGVVTWNDFHGSFININCPMPKNNLPHYIKFTVTHNDCKVEGCNLKATVIIEQYPTEYITSYFGWHSYRDDFISTENEYPMTQGFSLDACNITNIFSKSNDKYRIVRLYKGPKDPNYNEPLAWSYRIKRATGTNSSGSGFFKSKVAKQPEEENNTSFFKWSSYWTSESTTGFMKPKISISQFGYRDKSFSLPEGEVYNPRIYQINITSTKKPDYQIQTGPGSQTDKMDYDVTQPRLDERGYTDSSLDNLRLVSPAFAVASRLGAVSSRDKVLKENSDGTVPKLSENNNYIDIFYLDPSEKDESYKIAAEHCARYVEVYKQRDKDGNLIEGAEDIVLDNWRLPTPAELRILIYYQGESDNKYAPDALDYQLPANYFWTADPSGPVYNWNHSGAYNTNDVGLRCVHDMTGILTGGN